MKGSSSSMVPTNPEAENSGIVNTSLEDELASWTCRNSGSLSVSGLTEDGRFLHNPGLGLQQTGQQLPSALRSYAANALACRQIGRGLHKADGVGAVSDRVEAPQLSCN